MSTKEKLFYKIVENHPNDSRVKLKEDGICQSLTTRMGTGGGQYSAPYGIQKERTPNEQRTRTRMGRGNRQ